MIVLIGAILFIATSIIDIVDTFTVDKFEPVVPLITSMGLMVMGIAFEVVPLKRENKD